VQGGKAGIADLVCQIGKVRLICAIAHTAKQAAIAFQTLDGFAAFGAGRHVVQGSAVYGKLRSKWEKARGGAEILAEQGGARRQNRWKIWYHPYVTIAFISIFKKHMRYIFMIW
jgi:hypothetical protein